MKKRILAGLTAFMLISVLSGCNNREYDFFSVIEGTVYDAASGEPLPNVAVVLTPGSRTLLTMKDGMFVFDGLDPGQYMVSFQKEGYYADRKTVLAVSGETVRTDISMRKIE